MTPSCPEHPRRLMDTLDTILEHYQAKARPPTTPVKFSALLRRLDEAVINALNNGGPWSQVDQLQAELIACLATWSMQQVDYYIRQTLQVMAPDLKPAVQAADLNWVRFTHEEQTLIIMLLRDMDVPTYKGRVIFRDSILEKYMSTMNPSSIPD